LLKLKRITTIKEVLIKVKAQVTGSRVETITRTTQFIISHLEEVQIIMVVTINMMITCLIIKDYHLARREVGKLTSNKDQE
jgi:hypothetical protein